MKNIEDLRTHLFATLEDLRDKKTPMDLDRAEAVAKVAQVIVNSVKVENDHLKLTGGIGSGFVPQKAIEQKPGTTAQPRLVRGV